MMKNANAKSACTESTAISDAEMVAELANSNWATMERDANTFATTTTTKKSAKKNDVKPVQPSVDKQMAAAHDVGADVVSRFHKRVTDDAKVTS